MIHSDITGPFPQPSISKARYVLTFIDDLCSDFNFKKNTEGCILGKHPEQKFDKGKAQRASSPLGMIHSDITGPFPQPSISKARYVLTFIDDLCSDFNFKKNTEVKREKSSMKVSTYQVLLIEGCKNGPMMSL
jgi:hypothetical protein